MAVIPDAFYSGTADKISGAVIQSLVTEVQTRKSEAADAGTDDEQYRVIVRCTLWTERANITRLDNIITTLPTLSGSARTIRGSFKGGDEISVTVSDDYSAWRCTGDNMTGTNAAGSTFASEGQQWVAVSDYADAPWNP